MVTILVCKTRFSIQQFHVLPTQGTYVFFTDLRTNNSMVLTETWICALLGSYATSNGSFYRSFVTTYKSHIQGSSSSRAQMSFTPRWNPEMEKETFRILWTLKMYYPLNKGLTLVYIVNQIIPFRILLSYSFKIRLNLILPFTLLFSLC